MSQIKILHSKIHNIAVTEANLNYVGSITIDKEIMDAANLFPWQEVFIVNNNNGARFETYVIPGKSGSKKICLNGSAARQVQVGDVIIVMNYHAVNLTETHVKNYESYSDDGHIVNTKRSVSNFEYYLTEHSPKVVMLGSDQSIVTFVALGEEEGEFIKQ